MAYPSWDRTAEVRCELELDLSARATFPEDSVAPAFRHWRARPDTVEHASEEAITSKHSRGM